MIEYAVAGEKMKWYGTGINVKWEKIEVGDEEGHVIGNLKPKQNYITIVGKFFPSVNVKSRISSVDTSLRFRFAKLWLDFAMAN